MHSICLLCITKLLRHNDNLKDTIPCTRIAPDCGGSFMFGLLTGEITF